MHARRSSNSSYLLLFGALAACGPATPDAEIDAGNTVLDAGVADSGAVAIDAGQLPVDAGQFDAGQFDAGQLPVDAGQVDAGQLPVDGGFEARNAAAKATAENAAACVSIKPFYWEVGDKDGARGSGSLAEGNKNYTADTSIGIASASKWFYSSYFVQKTNGVLSADDIKFMNFRSGYSDFSFCSKTDTVSTCADGAIYVPADLDKFAYSGGHMQKHAANNGLGAMNSAALATELKSQLGAEIDFSFNTPQPAGGIETTAADYAKLLRKIVSGQLVMKSILGTHSVCTNKDTCPDAVNAPSPPGESWHYSIGHWVEDDPTVGDGAFSSPGAFGFYPWVDSSKTVYGLVARDAFGGAISSVKCGRLIRKAWVTGTAQL